MKIRADRAALAETLTWVARAVDKRPAVPAMSGIKMTAADGVLTLSGYTYDVSHQAAIDVDVIDAGECLASASFLTTFVGQMRGTDIELVLDGETLSLASGRSSYRTRVLRLDDYPTLPDQAPLVGAIDAGVLAEAISICRRAAATDANLGFLAGIKMHGTSDDLRLSATNQRVLVDLRVDWLADVAFEALPPAQTIDESCKGLVGEVRIGASEGLLSLSAAGRSVTMRQMQDAYPPVDRVLAMVGEPPIKIEVEAGDLIEAATRTGKLSDDLTPITLEIGQAEIVLSVAARERGDGAEHIECAAVGTGSVDFAPKYLALGLQAMPPGRVNVEVNTNGKPSIVRPADDDGSRVALVMPKRGLK